MTQKQAWIISAVIVGIITAKIAADSRREEEAQTKELLKETDKIIDGWLKEDRDERISRMRVQIGLDSPLRKHYTEI